MRVAAPPEVLVGVVDPLVGHHAEGEEQRAERVHGTEHRLAPGERACRSGGACRTGWPRASSAVDATNDARKATFIPGHSRTSMAMTFMVATSTARASMAIMATLPLAAPVVFRSWWSGRVFGRACSDRWCARGDGLVGNAGENPSRRAFSARPFPNGRASGPGWIRHRSDTHRNCVHRSSISSRTSVWHPSLTAGCGCALVHPDHSPTPCSRRSREIRPSGRGDSRWGRPDVYRWVHVMRALP